MKFLVGFLVAFSMVIGCVGVAVAQCSCNQDPTIFGGGWGKTPPECLTEGGCSVSYSDEWQKTIEQTRFYASWEHLPQCYMNSDARDVAVRLYRDDPNRPVLHAEWYYHNPSYSSKWYRNPDGTLPSMALWDSLSIQEKYGW